MVDQYDVVIAGAGHGGANTALALRQLKFSGTIALIGEESEAPYERPALSKEYLAGERQFERMLIRPAAFWADSDVALLLGRRVIAVNPAGRRVTLDGGESLGYRKLVWAAGGTPRRLTCAGRDLQGVHTVRTRADVDRIRNQLATTGRVVVIGGGYIGLEVAAVLNTLGKHVTVLEAMDRVLTRVAGEPISRFYEAEHRARGVDIRSSAYVECIEEKDGRASGVRLTDGRLVPAEMVIVGIGIAPAVEPLIEAGAIGDNGVEVDERCRTSLPHVYAIGDCALHANVFAHGACIRLESVQNANQQASVAANDILGAPAPYRSVPWFWSSQYDLRLQTVGVLHGYDDIVLRGDPQSRSFSAIYLREGRVLALDCVNAIKDFVQGRLLVTASAASNPEDLANPGIALKSLLPSSLSD